MGDRLMHDRPWPLLVLGGVVGGAVGTVVLAWLVVAVQVGRRR